MRILFIADVVGSPGRKALRRFLASDPLPASCDFIVANAENVAGGKGLTPATAEELFEAGVHALTGGNHTWRNRDVFDVLDDPRVLRPANYPADSETPGRGYAVLTAPSGHRVAIVNLLGRVFLDHHEDPFAWATELVDETREETPVVLVDFHAEATSEKQAMFRFLDGRVTAVIGTHTHVQTADEQVSDGGTAYITDAGMTGAHDSILGVKTEIILRQFRTQLPVRHELAKGDVKVSGVVLEVDPLSGRARSIERFVEPPFPSVLEDRGD